MSHITLSPSSPVPPEIPPRCMRDYHVEVPCCSNSEALDKGEELMLHCALLRMEKPSGKRSRTWMLEAQAADGERAVSGSWHLKTICAGGRSPQLEYLLRRLRWR